MHCVSVRYYSCNSSRTGDRNVIIAQSIRRELQEQTQFGGYVVCRGVFFQTKRVCLQKPCFVIVPDATKAIAAQQETLFPKNIRSHPGHIESALGDASDAHHLV